MQVSTPIAQLGLGSELVDWIQTQRLYSTVFCWLTWKHDRLRYCTNTGSIPSKFFIPNRLKQWNFEHTKFLYSPSVPIIFPQTQMIFASLLPKKVYQVPLRIYSKSSQRKPAKHKLTSCAKVSKGTSINLSKKNHLETWRQRREVLSSQKLLQLIKVITLPTGNHYSWYGSVCSRPCFCKQEEFEYSDSYRAGNSKVSSWRKSHVQNPKIDSLKKKINKKLFAKADALVDKISSCPRMKVSNSQTLISHGVKTKLLLSDLAQQLPRKNADVTDVYFTLL